MGVIRNNFNNIRGGHQNGEDSGDDWIYISSDDGEESLDGQNDQTNYNNGRSHRTNKSKKSATKPEPTFSALGAKGKSHKKFRRYANGTFSTKFKCAL
ncbi:hypothetical protein BLA29_001597 [Euroglyphus maynei]|uniref:Uncharacterized protein n=1 Tax=Euroglyphus maynei TaxID=6958 RepID=A0A1Y3B0Z7_EURMA|nr:hypothetical protein BLA29_001597 [Euroglyphus maynei]